MPCSSDHPFIIKLHFHYVIVVLLCDYPTSEPAPVTFGGSVWVRAWAASSKGIVSSVPARFQADSGTNLFKQGEIVAGRPCGSVAQLARVLARYARGPGFESRSSHVLPPPPPPPPPRDICMPRTLILFHHNDLISYFFTKNMSRVFIRNA